MEFKILSPSRRSLESLPETEVVLSAEEVCVVAGVLYHSMSGDNPVRKSLEKFFDLFEELTGLKVRTLQNLKSDSNEILDAISRKLNAS